VARYLRRIERGERKTKGSKVASHVNEGANSREGEKGIEVKKDDGKRKRSLK